MQLISLIVFRTDTWKRMVIRDITIFLISGAASVGRIQEDTPLMRFQKGSSMITEIQQYRESSSVQSFLSMSADHRKAKPKPLISSSKPTFRAAWRRSNNPLKNCPTTIELSGLSDPQKKAFILADNRIALNSGWDIDLLRIELQELQDTDLAPVTGFSDEELNALLCGTTEPAEEEEEPEKEEPEADRFNLTLSIPIEYKEQVQDFVKSFGPEDLIQKIIDVTS